MLTRGAQDWGYAEKTGATVRDVEATALKRDGWTIDGPHFKDAQHYLSRDGTNPEAPNPGYGWPLGSECWYFTLEGQGLRLCATGLTEESASLRAKAIMDADEPARFAGEAS